MRMIGILLGMLLMVAPGWAQATLLFKSGFESASVLGPTTNDGNMQAGSNSTLQLINGIDASTGFNWTTLWGLFGSTFSGIHLIPGNGLDGQPFANAFKNALDTTQKHSGSQSLKMNVTGFTNPDCNPACGQDTGTLGGNLNVSQMYERLWLYIPSSTKTKMQAAGSDYEVLFEFKSSNNHRLVTYLYFNNGVNGNNLYWHAQSDSLTDVNSSINPIYWQQDNMATPVPLDQWFQMEFFFNISPTSSGRYYMGMTDPQGAAHTLIDQPGANWTCCSAEHIAGLFLMNLYGGHWPVLRWLDDLEIWNSPPCATLPCGGGVVPPPSITNYYVDPNYTGNTRTGTQAQPWKSLSDTVSPTPWAAINTSLAIANVNVYFAARPAASDTDNTVATTISLGLTPNRTTTTVLRLSGNEFYNATTGTAAPQWRAYSGSSRYHISTTGTAPAIDSTFLRGTNRMQYLTIHGMAFNTSGQVLFLTAIDNLTLENSEWYANTGSSIGPGLMLGATVNDSTSCTGYDHNWGRHVVIQNNKAHDTFGETIYVNGTTGDPTSCATNQPTGDDILITGNTIYNCGDHGSNDGDCIDVKDGNTNLRITHNQIYYDTNYNRFTGGEPCQALSLESVSLIDSNFFWTTAAPSSGCMITIRFIEAWGNTVGRSDVTIRNNIMVAAPTSTWGFSCGGCAIGNTVDGGGKFGNVHILDNTIVGYPFNISLAGGTITGTIDVIGNILMNARMTPLTVGAGYAAYNHDYNDFFPAGTGGEMHSLSVNPQFVNINSPYADSNFKLQSGSPVLGKGLTLASVPVDYFGLTRPSPPAMGAADSSGGPPPMFDFALSNGGNPSVVQGQSVTNGITAVLVSGASQSVSFSVAGLPSGATGSFSPGACSLSCTSTLSIATTPTTPAGTSVVTVTGVAGSIIHTTSFNLSVTTPSVTGTITISTPGKTTTCTTTPGTVVCTIP